MKIDSLDILLEEELKDIYRVNELVLAARDAADRNAILRV